MTRNQKISIVTALVVTLFLGGLSLLSRLQEAYPQAFHVGIKTVLIVILSSCFYYMFRPLISEYIKK